jgi:Na+-transporting methylmalonyl-CoA/oxaloacetate decarboxylase beta subunit
MIDFTPLLKNPYMIFFGAAAQFGIFATFLLTLLLLPLIGITDSNLIMRLASAVGIIGAADDRQPLCCQPLQSRESMGRTLSPPIPNVTVPITSRLYPGSDHREER